MLMVSWVAVDERVYNEKYWVVKGMLAASFKKYIIVDK
jgi:hypothetical protein